MSFSMRPTVLLLSGTAVAQLIALAVSPLLTRQFGPQNFGELALYTSLLGVLTALASGRYELAILLPTEDDQAVHLMALSMLLALLFTLVLCIFLVFFDTELADFFGWQSARPWLGVLPWACFCSVGFAVCSAWANRKAHYRLLAAHRILQSLAVALISVVLGWVGWSEAGLVWGSFIGLLLTLASISCFVWQVTSSKRPVLSWSMLRQVALQHIAFPRLNLPHALLDNVQSALLLALINAAWGATALGFYAFALRIVRTPFAMVGSAMGQVFQRNCARAFNELRPLRPLVLLQWRKQLPYLLLLIFLGVSSPWMFEGVFGAPWHEAGNFALIVTPWMALNFLVSPLSQIPQIIGRQGAALMWGLAYQASMLLPICAAWMLGLGVRPALLAQSVCSSLLLAAYGAWLLHISSQVRPDE